MTMKLPKTGEAVIIDSAKARTSIPGTSRTSPTGWYGGRWHATTA